MSDSDCCGNGCANCILDAKPVTKTVIHGKRNILDAYHKFELVARWSHGQLEETEVIELHFKVAAADIDDDVMLYVPPGHHVMMRINTNDSVDTKHLRPYSPFWFDVERLEFKILVNLKPQGIMSKYLANLMPDGGEELAEFRLHHGTYLHQPLPVKCLVIISQGIAIASTVTIIEEVLHNDEDNTRIIHLACFQDLRHFYFRQRLREYAQYWNYWNHAYLAHEVCKENVCQLAGSCLAECINFRKSLQYKEQVRPQRLTAADIQNAIELRAPPDSLLVFVLSGSRAFQDNIKMVIENMDLPKKEMQLL